MPWSPLLRPFYMCKFLCRCISSMICLLTNLYIWERSPFSWYPISFELPWFLSIILWWLQICFMSAYLNFICIFAHSCICWGSFTSCLPWWVCWFLLARCFHKLLAFSIGFIFQLVSLSLRTSLLSKDLLLSWLGLSYDWIFENWYLLMAQPHLWCKCFVLL